MENLALNKSVTASDVTYPYTPSKAVDGLVNPFSRWQSNNVPCWLNIDLGKPSFVNHWIVRHLPTAGWSAPYYVLTEFTLQVSNDNVRWINVDTVKDNMSSITDHTFQTCMGRYFRIYITKGLKSNPKTASIVELEIYRAAEL